MEWKNIDFRREKIQLPGCLNLDTNDGTFVSATFRLKDNSIVRLRRDNYGTVFERKVIPTEHMFIVTAKVSGILITQEFKSKEVAKKFECTLLSGSDAEEVELKEIEKEILQSVNAGDKAIVTSDDIPF